MCTNVERKKTKKRTINWFFCIAMLSSSQQKIIGTGTTSTAVPTCYSIIISSSTFFVTLFSGMKVACQQACNIFDSNPILIVKKVIIIALNRVPV